METLEHAIAAELVRQGNNLDDLGDGESVCLMGKLPTINLAELVEMIEKFYGRD